MRAVACVGGHSVRALSGFIYVLERTSVENVFFALVVALQQDLLHCAAGPHHNRAIQIDACQLSERALGDDMLCSLPSRAHKYLQKG